MTDFPVGQSNQRAFSAPSEPSFAEADAEQKIARFQGQETIDRTLPGPRICERCCNFFDYRPRSQGELEAWHQALFMTGPAVNHVPLVCTSCYEATVYSALKNHQVEMIGRSNSGPSNLLLKMAE